ncbi:MAG: transporter substrate-binding domain-containing protein [Methylocystis sp.]|nr:transporter substrate-binding domain-containing protein [Methylocystis sp.]MBI3274494.1 transporter substrate-binding domain-containing protein [Methylocystis sp.]
MIRLVAMLLFCISRAPFAHADEQAFAPSFWDTRRTLEKPDTSGLRQIRFLTEDDFPPFDFALPDGALAGFNVDLARAICEELELSCTIQRRRWDLLIPSLKDNSGDALVASLAITDEAREKLDFTAPYYTTPGRFVTLNDSQIRAATPKDFDDRSIAVVAGSAHESFLKTFFPTSVITPFVNAQLARNALKQGHVQALFGDAISLSFWLNGAEAAGCCVFKDGPFTDVRFFGEGVGIAVKKDNKTLRRALDYALARLAQKGVYAELYLKYFPIGPF